MRAGALGIIAAAALLTACGPVATSRAPVMPSPAATSLSDCITTAAPTSAAALQDITDHLASPLFTGADVAASARLADGRTVWLFGDSARWVGSSTAIVQRNAMLLQDGTCMRVVRTGSQGVIPNRSDGVGYWPMSALVQAHGGDSTLVVTAQRVRGSAEAFSFTNLGAAIAVFDVSEGGAPRLVSVTDVGTDSPSRTRPAYGAATFDAGEWWYLYGTSNPEKPDVFGWAVRVARVRPTQVSDVSAWQYWDGHAWTRDPGAAVPVIAADGGVSQTFSVVEHDGVWYAVSKLEGDLGDTLAFWPAPHPWGPYADPVPVGSIPNAPDGSVLRYMPLAHPELSSGDALIVSVSRNSMDLRLLADHPSLYRPFFFTVPLPPQPSQRPLDTSADVLDAAGVG